MSSPHRIGHSAAFQSVSEDARLRLVFEDDGSTGYLYVLDHTDAAAQPIKDAVHLYNAVDSQLAECTVAFRWSGDGRRCVLFMDQVAVAFVDFDRRVAVSRSNFPATSAWTQQSRALWSEGVVEALEGH